MIVAAALCKNGLIFTIPPPARHDTIIRSMIEARANPTDAEQGFLTQDGRFLRRAPALRHAIECGQLPEDVKLCGGLHLTSEDLW